MVKIIYILYYRGYKGETFPPRAYPGREPKSHICEPTHIPEEYQGGAWVVARLPACRWSCWWSCWWPRPGGGRVSAVGDPLPTTRAGLVVPLCGHSIPSARGRASGPEECVPYGSWGCAATFSRCARLCTPATAAQAPRRTRALEQRHSDDMCTALLTWRFTACAVEAYARRGPEDAASGTCGRKSLVARRLHSYRVPGGDRDQ